MDNTHSERGYPVDFGILGALTLHMRFPCLFLALNLTKNAGYVTIAPVYCVADTASYLFDAPRKCVDESERLPSQYTIPFPLFEHFSFPKVAFEH
jgi:hypothetical protein